MGFITVHLKPAVAAIALVFASLHPAMAKDAGDRVEALLEELSSAEGPQARKIARDIEIAWSQSGSASANLLLRRGEDALDEEDYVAAVEHFSALTDHAPDFAEGWHGRARAFYALEEYGLALNDLQQTLALNPQHFGAIFGLGTILEQVERPQAAHEAYKILLNLYPAHEKALEATARLERDVNGTEL